MCHERRQQGGDGNGARWPACTHKTQRPRLARIHARSGSPVASGRNPTTARSEDRSSGRLKPIKTLCRFALFHRCKPGGFWRPPFARRRSCRGRGRPPAHAPSARHADRDAAGAHPIEERGERLPCVVRPDAAPQDLRNARHQRKTRLSYYSSSGLAAKHESNVLGQWICSRPTLVQRAAPSKFSLTIVNDGQDMTARTNRSARQ